MDDQTRERWFQLCQLASVEQDPEKLLALVIEINCLLEAKETTLKDSSRGSEFSMDSTIRIRQTPRQGTPALSKPGARLRLICERPKTFSSDKTRL